MSDDRLKSILDDRDSGAPISRIVRAMSEWGALSGAEIARRTGLARSTVSVALSKLRESGIVVELPEQAEASKGVGRPATPLALNPEAGTCVGVHLALDELRIAVADVAHSVIDEQSVPLGRDYAPEAAAEAARSAIASVYAAHGLRPSGLLGVGISVSGPLRPDGRVIRASILPRWAGVNVRDVFGPVLERPVFAANESNCAAIAEMTWGAAAGEDDFVLFKIDVGLGGAIVRDGTVLTGIAGGAGEFGHVSIDPQGPLCRCGNRGCLELYAGFSRPLDELARIHGRPLGMDDTILLAEQGDAVALRLIEDTGEIAGRGLAMIGNILNPPLILVTGRMAVAGDLLLAPLVRAYEKHILIKSPDLPATLRTRIKLGHFTENDALLGAVGLVLKGQGRLG
ncbi:MAG: ROK family transcriptional regulator [Rhodobacteraceae bacterium]|nr:ROK family transcriptional regulator [Paracoccaceae bacterium]MCB1375306.1 ROK family transcriptional regulator [Paracoccaceae bacterium]MCB1402978.1 ROK family transcriptional regulator [Paracoccaceae bacterium]